MTTPCHDCKQPIIGPARQMARGEICEPCFKKGEPMPGSEKETPNPKLPQGGSGSAKLNGHDDVAELAAQLGEAMGPCVVCEKPIGPDELATKTRGGYRHADCKPKSKGPRKPRTPAKTVILCERLFSRFDVKTRQAMYTMLGSVCEPAIGETP